MRMDGCKVGAEEQSQSAEAESWLWKCGRLMQKRRTQVRKCEANGAGTVIGRYVAAR